MPTIPAVAALVMPYQNFLDELAGRVKLFV